MNSRINIEVLRGIAALSVFFSHSDASHLATTEWLSANKEILGIFGVYLFFGISGYLIWGSITRCMPQSNGAMLYAVHRLTRIVPLYLINICFVVFFLGFIGSSFSPIVTVESIFRHLTFTQSLNPTVSRQINPVLWTLTHEFLFYVLAPILFLASYKIPLYLLLFILLCISGISSKLDFGTFNPFFQVLYPFIVGIILAELKARFIPLALTAIVCILIFAIIYLSSLQFEIAIGALALLTLALSPAAIAITSFPIVKRLVTPLAFIGTISYSLYIWHYLLICIVEHHLPFLKNHVFWLANYDLVKSILFTGFVILVSWISYCLIELPAMGRVRQKLMSYFIGNSV